MAHQHCLTVTQLLSPPSLSSLPTFPLVLGRRPALVTTGGNSSLEKENRAPENIGAGMAESLISKVSDYNSLDVRKFYKTKFKRTSRLVPKCTPVC